MMNTINTMNRIAQTSNLVVQSMNGSDLTLTHVLIAVGGGLVLGGVLIALANWLLKR